MLPSPDSLNKFQAGRFVLSNLAAKRAKQLREGAPPLVNIESNHPLTIALEEIAAGRITPIMPSLEATAVVEATDLPEIFDEDELGMLLPALDETEVALVVGEVAEEDHEHDQEHDHEGEAAHEEPEVIALADLVEHDEEDVTPPSEDDTLSLSDIAEQETTLEDDEPEE